MHNTENLFVHSRVQGLDQMWYLPEANNALQKASFKSKFSFLSFTFILNEPLWKVKFRFHCVILLASGLEEEWKSHGVLEAH